MNKPKVLFIISRGTEELFNTPDHLERYLGEKADLSVARVRLPGNFSDARKVLPALRETLRLLPGINAYDAVVSFSLINGLFFALMQKVAGRALRPVHIAVDIGSTKYLEGAGGRLRRKLTKSVFLSAGAIVCFAQSAVAFWKERMGFPGACLLMPLPVNDVFFERTPSRGEYLFSAGREDRDYATLLDALGGVPSPVLIYGDAEHGSALSTRLAQMPDVTYVADRYGEAYIEALRNAAIVVVPLESTGYHAGQTVVVQAMAMGKAVIAARTRGTVDYVTDGVDGLLYTPGDRNDLGGKIRMLLGDTAKAAALGAAARDKALARFSEKAFADSLAALIAGIRERGRDRGTI